VEQYYEEYDGKKIYPPYGKYRERGLTEEDLKIMHACYCAEITMVDRWIGRLLERMESLDLLENTAIIFTSDHGFYFGEHGGIVGKQLLEKERSEIEGRPLDTRENCWIRCPLYDEVARVPLMIYLPQAKPTRSNAWISLPDLMPTILDLVQVTIPDTVQAPSIAPLLKGKERKIHDFVVTTMPLYLPGERTRVVDDMERELKELPASTISDEEWTLIYSIAGEPVELYHTASDPKQEKNVFNNNKEAAEKLHGKFVQFLEDLKTDERLLDPRRNLL
jgi:arylsulfatase A-like enzyme